MRWAGLFIVLTLAVAPPALAADELQPFASDGCSAFPDGTPTRPHLWCGCCVAHDLAYWQGGTAEQKRQADDALQRCVKAAADSETLASLMELGVRVGGQPQLPSTFRWGYGWPARHGYFDLSPADREQVLRRLGEHSYSSELALRCPAL